MLYPSIHPPVDPFICSLIHTSIHLSIHLSLQVITDFLNLYLIDDSLDHDVPLLELSLTSLQAANQTAVGIKGSAMTTLSLDYYNRNISAWEPIVEPWK